MQCPLCKHPNNRVLDSSSAEAGRSIRRRRECLNCERRFTTYERIEYVPVTVLKRNGDRESFDRSKLLKGIIRACEKTGVSSLQIEAVVDEIEAELQQQTVREATSESLGQLVLERIRSINEVAYVRFASVYQQFQGIRDFADALSHLESQLEGHSEAPSAPSAHGSLSTNGAKQGDTPDSSADSGLAESHYTPEDQPPSAVHV